MQLRLLHAPSLDPLQVEATSTTMVDLAVDMEATISCRTVDPVDVFLTHAENLTNSHSRSC